MSSVELIPGTALPIHTGPGGQQTEGRGEIELRPERGPVSLLEKAADRFTPAELAYASAALRAFDNRPKSKKQIMASTAGRTDSSTGNLVIEFFTVPGGCEASLTSVLIDVPNSSTINPSAPYANASSWAFLALAGATSGQAAATADGLRPAMVAFAPVSAAGPLLPGQWTFNEDEAPLGQSGDGMYFVLHGGSIAALLGISIQVTYRIVLYGE